MHAVHAMHEVGSEKCPIHMSQIHPSSNQHGSESTVMPFQERDWIQRLNSVNGTEDSINSTLWIDEFDMPRYCKVHDDIRK